MMTTKSCSNCNAFVADNEQQGTCRASPPMPVLVGMRPPVMQGQPPIPVFQAMFPTVGVGWWCRKHVQVIELSKIDMSNFGQLAPEGSA